jgi:hypothetical protein
VTYRLFLVPVLVLCLGATPPSVRADSFTSPVQRSEIEKALNRLYNFDFPNSHRLFSAYTSNNPEDPLGHSFRAAAYMFYELDRLRLLEAEFFKDDDRIKEKPKLQPDPEVRKAFFSAVEKGATTAKAILAVNPSDVNALYAMVVLNGLQLDYAALIDKKLVKSLTYARESNTYAVKLLAVNPHFYDAYLTLGFSEYLLGSMPFFVRWFIKWEGVKGDKEIGRQKLEIAAQKATYMKSFAQLLLAIFYFRENRLEKSAPLMNTLAADYPENEMIQRELKKLNERLARQQRTSR